MKKRNKYFGSLVWMTKLQWQTSRGSLAWSLFFSIFSGIKPLVQTYALARLIASVSSAALQHGPSNQVYVWLTVLLIIELLNQAVSSIDRIARLRFQQKMEVVTNERFFVKMYELSQQQFDDEEFNTKLGRARDSLNQIWRVIDEISFAISSMISFSGAFIAVFVVSPLVGILIAAAIVPVGYLQIKQNRSRDLAYKKVEPYDRVAYRTRWLLIDPNFMPEVRLMNAFKNMIGNWREHLTKSQDLMYKNDKRLLKYDVVADTAQPIVSFGANIYFFKLLLAGTIGLDRFIFLRGMLEQAVSSAGVVSSSIQRLHELSINLENFSEVYDTPPAISNGSHEVGRPLKIEFQDVSFSYPGTDQAVLKDVSFVIAPGSKLALVGENGAGKTTLIKLLLRQYLPTKGKILVNDVDIKDVDINSYYGAISNLSQDYLLVNHIPIRDNLLIGIDRKVDDKELYKITDLVDATHFIDKLPKKLGTRLDSSFDDGGNLSGGQRQRLVVARALLQSGDILILDEPTSAIDAKAEYNIFNNIYRAHSGKTTLIVSHRFSTVRKAEKIIVLEQGKITEYGSHEELLKFGGLYKEMFEAQAEGYK